MSTEKVRVYALAKTLDVESKVLIEIGKELGFDIRNQLSNLEQSQADAIVDRLKNGSKPAPAPTPAAPAVLPTNISTKVQTLPSRKTAPKAETTPAAVATPEADVETAPAEPSEPPAPTPTPTPTPAATPPDVQPAPVAAAETPATVVRPTPPVGPAPAVSPDAPHPVTPPTPAAVQRPGSTLPPRPTPRPGSTLPPRPTPRPVSPRPTPRPEGGGPGTGAPRLRTILRRPAPGAQNFAPRPGGQSLRQPPSGQSPAGGATTPGAPVAKPRDTGVRKLADIPQQMRDQGRNVTAEQVLRAQQAQTAPDANFVPSPSDMEEDDGKGGKKKPGAVGGRDVRRAARNVRAKERTTQPGKVQLQGGQVVVEEDRPLRVRDRLKHRPKQRTPGTAPRKGKVQVSLPITVRALSEAVGVAFSKLATKLIALGLPFGSFTINSVLDPEIAELVAQEAGCELEIRKSQDAEEALDALHKEADDPAKLKPRPPVVTIMGHVDHGKTSLLDRIRKSNVVDTEAGGITQVIRAWKVEHQGKQITFLDTPGHEAFTKMRARGAQVTDIAVIVVAADDGVMPQTEEAINHAKAAGVKIVVAINKVDLPNANLNKTRQQLYSLDLLPDDMGGDVPFVETSAAKGKGINELLEAILLVAELQLDLKANPDKPGRGTCLEANLSGDAGVNATLLVRDGTLKRGEIIVCGPAFGRVRAMFNDLGQPIEEAPPGTPVRVIGLDEVPNADDAFSVVEDISTAREVAEKRRNRLQAESQTKYVPMTLEKLGEAKIDELKVILKADFRGSVEAIRKELEKLTHEEVRVRVLHAGIGAITVSDVQLAMTSPGDTMVVGFNAVPDDEALALAEHLGIPIREYSIIYNLTDDIKAALEGRLKPHQQVVHLGRAVVREVFKISKVGAVAGCHVTQGVIERAAKVRVIRGGVVVYPPADRTASLESLKHHKDDVKDIKQGYDCGIKIAGYDDVKPDDVIEAYRVEEIKRTL